MGLARLCLALLISWLMLIQPSQRGTSSPDTAPHPLKMGQQILRQLLPQGKVHLPRQQKVINSSHQSQTIAMAELISYKATINIGSILVAAHCSGAKQPDFLKLSLCSK